MSIGANYRTEGREPIFVAKLGKVLEGADESLYWLEMIRDGKFVSEIRLSLILREANELTAIVAVSRKSALKNKSQISNLES